jgi:lysyl-tRNA synthetase class I
MKLTKGEILATLSIVVGVISTGAGVSTAVVSADSISSATQTSSTVARSVVHQDQLEVMAKVLNMTTADVQTHLKAHDLKQVVANAGLSDATYHQNVQAQLRSELQAQGYSQEQVDNAMQHYQQHANRN